MPVSSFFQDYQEWISRSASRARAELRLARSFKDAWNSADTPGKLDILTFLLMRPDLDAWKTLESAVLSEDKSLVDYSLITVKRHSNTKEPPDALTSLIWHLSNTTIWMDTRILALDALDGRLSPLMEEALVGRIASRDIDISVRRKMGELLMHAGRVEAKGTVLNALLSGQEEYTLFIDILAHISVLQLTRQEQNQLKSWASKQLRALRKMIRTHQELDKSIWALGTLILAGIEPTNVDIDVLGEYLESRGRLDVELRALEALGAARTARAKSWITKATRNKQAPIREAARRLLTES